MTRPFERLSASHHPRTVCFPRRAWALVVGILVGWAGPGHAALIISAPTVVASAGSSGAFDLIISNDLTGPTVNVGGFNLDFFLTGPPGVQFTGATIATTPPYIFVTSGTTVPGGDPLSTDPFPNTGFTAADTEFAPPFSRTIAPGDTFGLVHVLYSVAPGAAAGIRTLSFGPDTFLSDEAGDPVPIAAVLDGTFEVIPSVVPEPSTIVLTTLGGVMALIVGRGRGRGRRDAAPAPPAPDAGSAA